MNALIASCLTERGKHFVLKTRNIFRVLVNSNGSTNLYICLGENWVKAFICARWKDSSKSGGTSGPLLQSIFFLLSCQHSFRGTRLFVFVNDENLFSNEALCNDFSGSVDGSCCLGAVCVCGGDLVCRSHSFPAITTSMYITSYISALHPVNCVLCQLDYANDMKS